MNKKEFYTYQKQLRRFTSFVDMVEAVEEKNVSETDKIEIIAKNKMNQFYLLLDYLQSWDRFDWGDKDVVDLYDYVLCCNNYLKDMFIEYIVNGYTIDYILPLPTWLLPEVEVNKICDMIENEDNAIGILVLCVRKILDGIIQGKLRYTVNDFISIIEESKWKTLEIY